VEDKNGKDKTKMKNTEKAQEAINKIIELFQDPKDLAGKIAFATISGFGKPSDSWSLNNRILQMLAETEDGRSFEAWKKIKRYPKKGSKAFYILRPIMVPIANDIKDEGGTVIDTKKFFILKGFTVQPEFRYEDTEGAELKENKKEMPEPRLKEIAEELGLKVGYMNSNGHSWGWFSKTQQEIRLGTTDERVFFHELAHAIDHKFNEKNWKGGQDAVQEITAELSAAVLGMLYGMDVVKNHYDYIQHYAGQFKSVEDACIKVMARVEKVINFVLDRQKKEYSKEEDKAA